MKGKQKSFTLIEILVVVVIIGLLASIILASLDKARIKAKDARRKMDLHQIQQALELYINEYDVPPTPSQYGENNFFNFDLSCQGDFMQFLEGAVDGYEEVNPQDIQFISEVPKDPKDDFSLQLCYGYT